MIKNKVTELLNIKYPIIQAGMIWCSGWELASAVSNAGGLGTLGSGSMYPSDLESNIKKCIDNTAKPFAVNIPLFYPDIESHIELILQYKVPVVITSAGNPNIYTKYLQEKGIIVIHVVSSLKFALKAQEAGVDAIVAEGFEAGGHNGREETTTMCLIPSLVGQLTIPIIAAGGIANGRTMLASICLGADGVQIGSRFVASIESSAHINFKKEIIKAKEGDTVLTMKELIPVRLLKNKFYNELEKLYIEKADIEQIRNHLGRARSKEGMYIGDLNNGELEIGQIASIIDDILPASKIIENIINEYNTLKNEIKNHENY